MDNTDFNRQAVPDSTKINAITLKKTVLMIERGK